MGDFGQGIRLQRILRQDRRTLIVAFDHALVLGPIPVTLEPVVQIRRFIEANRREPRVFSIHQDTTITSNLRTEDSDKRMLLECAEFGGKLHLK